MDGSVKDNFADFLEAAACASLNVAAAENPRKEASNYRSASLRVRRALLFYALRRLGLDVAAEVRPANEQHIVLLNRAEVEAARVRPMQT